MADDPVAGDRLLRGMPRPRGFLFKLFGPADLGPEHRGNPLKGTAYDPALRQSRRSSWRRRRDAPGEAADGG